MKTQNLWYSNADKKYIDDLLKDRYDDPLLLQLNYILDKLIKDAEVTPDYDNPSWAYAQADRNGRVAAYKRIKRLLPVKENNINE